MATMDEKFNKNAFATASSLVISRDELRVMRARDKSAV
jgi:hypothetical protein